MPASRSCWRIKGESTRKALMTGWPVVSAQCRAASSYFLLRARSAPSLTHLFRRKACTVGHEGGTCTIIPFPAEENGRLAPCTGQPQAPRPPAPPLLGTELGGPLEGAAGGAEGDPGSGHRGHGPRGAEAQRFATPQAGRVRGSPLPTHRLAAPARGRGSCLEVGARASRLRLHSPCWVSLLAIVGFELRSPPRWGLEDKAYTPTGVGDGGVTRKRSKLSRAGDR